MTTYFSDKNAAETEVFTFDFSSLLADGETISGTPTVAATVASGTDPNASAIVSGAAQVSGAEVTQLITAGVSGVTYTLTCTANTSLGQVLVLAGDVAVV